jgi:predicted outer membrane repeat protein
MVRISTRLLLFAAILLALLAPARSPVQADPAEINGLTPIVVNTTALLNDPNDGKCDLWEALKATFDLQSSGISTYHECKASPGPNVITFDPTIAGQTITLPAAQPYPELPFINADVTIMGPIILNGGGKAADLHVFRLASTGRLTLVNLTVTNGFTSGSGGAILDNAGGTINLIGVSMVGNTAESNGGAIDSVGDVNIVGSSFLGNRAIGTRDSGTNDQSGTGFGGALSIGGYASLTVAGSTFNANTADKGGGAIYFSGDKADIVDTTFNANVMNDLIPTANPDTDLRGGGAIFTDPNAIVNITRVAFDANISLTGHGGALYTAIDGEIKVADSSFNANAAGDLLHDQMGGAWYNGGGILDIRRSAFLFNIATSNGGGLSNDRTGEATLANTTFFKNDASDAGGALWNGQTQTGGPGTYLWGYNLTIADNDTAQGAVFNQEDGSHEVSLGNVIIRHDADPAANCFGPITSLGHNVDSGTSCAFGGTGDLSSTDPKLQSLGFNGGALTSLLSMKLDKTSPAAGTGDSAICQNAFVDKEDQRGESRPQSGGGGDGCDRGAVENDTLKPGYGSTPVQPGPLDFGSVQVGNSYQLAFDIFETGNDTLTVSAANLSGTNANQFSINTVVPLSIDDGAAAKQFKVTCAPTGGAGARTATLTLTTNAPDHLSVSYNLTCNATVAPVAGFASDPIAPGPIDFGQTTLSISKTLALTVVNTGNAVLTLSNLQQSGVNPTDFLLKPALPKNVAVGGQMNFSLECTPLDVGLRTAIVTLTTNDPAHPTVSFNLVCEGVAPPSPVIAPPATTLAVGLPAIDAPYGVDISPDGETVYAAGFASNSLIAYNRNPLTGDIAWIQTLTDPAGDLNAPYHVLVSPDGKNVYASASSSEAITVFTRNPDTGLLTKLDSVHDGDNYGCRPICFALNGLDGAYGMAISPDGRYFYASGINDDAIVVLRRNADGSLSGTTTANYVQNYVSSTDLDAAYDVALSPDGAHLYAVGYTSDTLLTFDRDAVSGHITFVEKLSAATIAGLNGVFRVIVSDDGQFVYTASYDSDSVTAFRRDISTGKLTHIATYTQGVNGVSGLDAATSVALTPDQRYLFVTGYNSDALTVFARDPETGLLTFVQSVKRGDWGAGLPALDGARDVVVSPEGTQVFATGYLDDRVTAFRIANPVPVLSSLLPASARQGDAAFPLQVNGENFVPDSVVRWSGTDLATTYVSPHQLEAAVPAANLATAGTFKIEVFNPAPGGGISINDLAFTVSAPSDNLVPAVTALLPASTAAGSSDFTLTVNGSGFVAGATVQWNGVDRPTTYIGQSELQASIPAALVAQPGMASVRVVNPAPGGGPSNLVAFDIAAPGENPIPGITAISPTWAYGRGADSQPQTLTVNGMNFLPESVVYWNGYPRPTTYISPTQLQTTLGGADLAYPQMVVVSVVNPGPGGGESNLLEFAVTRWYGVFIPLVAR